MHQTVTPVTKPHWKGTCDACYLTRNEHKRETLEHICVNCPFYTSIIRAVLFNVINAFNDNDDILKILSMNEERINETFARELISGSTKFSKLKCLKSLSTIWPNIAGATLLAILKARNQNADPNYPPKVNAEEIYNEICNNILSIALAERKKADIRAKTLEIRYQYTPKEDACPIAKWKKDWSKIIKNNQGKMSTTFTKFKNTPFLSLTPDPNPNDVNRRNAYRSLQMNANKK